MIVINHDDFKDEKKGLTPTIDNQCIPTMQPLFILV
jgi:hypothetical protein